MNLKRVSDVALAYANDVADRTPVNPEDDPHDVKNSDYSVNHHLISALPDDERELINALVRAML